MTTVSILAGEETNIVSVPNFSRLIAPIMGLGQARQYRQAR